MPPTQKLKPMKNKIFALIACAIASASCQKEPSASFKTDKTEYIAGETVHLTNNSIDSYSYVWTMPDGQIMTSENVDYITNVSSGNASLTFKLMANSKNGKNQDEISQTVTLKEATGSIVFWQSGTPAYGVTKIGVQKSDYTGTIYEQSITIDTSSPECGKSGLATFTLPVGDYAFVATDDTYNWEGIFSITKDNCLKFQLQ